MLTLDNIKVPESNLAISLASSAATLSGMGDELMDGFDGLFGVTTTDINTININ